MQGVAPDIVDGGDMLNEEVLSNVSKTTDQSYRQPGISSVIPCKPYLLSHITV